MLALLKPCANSLLAGIRAVKAALSLAAELVTDTEILGFRNCKLGGCVLESISATVNTELCNQVLR